MTHQPVLLHEVIEALNIKKDGIYVDATFGRGGHSSELLKHLDSGKLFVFDQDLSAIEAAKVLQKSYPKQLVIAHENFENLFDTLKLHDIHAVDGVLFDLGVSSPQFDEAERGFSYRFDHRLDMRMNQAQILDAYIVINTYSFEQLKSIFKNYGEEPFAKSIARKIEQQRQIKPIETTFELVDIIKSALPAKVLSQKGHPAKQVFMALRIEVNRELEVLSKAIQQAIQLLKPDGRLAIISFHSLEDRLVKQKFIELTTSHTPRKLPIIDEVKPTYRLLQKKPILAQASEQKENSRSHSAKLRVLIKN
jgi:16S rRNA (cytosine1402-N4)-methyltransferase